MPAGGYRGEGHLEKPTALDNLRAGGARNPHVLDCTLRFLRSGDAQILFARYGSSRCPVLKVTGLNVPALQRTRREFAATQANVANRLGCGKFYLALR